MIMKKYIYVFSVLLFAAIGCTKELEQTVPGIDGDFPEGAKALVTFSIPAPPETKAGMAVEPIVENLYVAVFNSAGLLKEYTKAEPVQLATANATWYTYQVSLMLSSSERRLHFIANGPESITDGTESAVIRALETANGDAAYWQRVVLEHGITPYEYPGGVVTYTWTDEGGEHSQTYGTDGGNSYVDGTGLTVNKGDYVQQNGNKVTDGTGYFASVTTTTELAKVPLIRNFARITVTKKASGGKFEPIQFKTIYTPNKGYVAPYDAHADEFVVPYMDAYNHTESAQALETYTNGLLTRLKTSGYKADMPIDATLSSYTQAQVNAMTFLTPGNYDFMYERGIPNEDAIPTCVLVQGYLLDRDPQKRNPRWFKIEILDADGNYLPIYRDVTYNMEIASIEGTPGWDTAWQAYDNLSVGDVSTSTTTETLNQISDGKGTTLWVEYIDYTSVETNATTVTIKYKLFYEEGTTTENLTGTNVTLRVDSYNGITPAITSTTITGSAYSGTDTPDGKSGWYIASVPLDVQGTSLKKSCLHIEGITKAGNGQKAVFRDVDYRVMPPAEMTVTSGTDNGDVKLSINLPKDLGFSMFPLVLKIEAEKGDLNPSVGRNVVNGSAVDLPTEYGASMFTDAAHTGHNTFYFLFTVNFSDYDQANGSTYELYFKKTRNSDNSTQVKIQDKKPFFKLATVNL